MRLLLTRAAEDAARTRVPLEAAGHEVVVSPVIAIRATGALWPSGVVDAVLATSAHAFASLICGPAPAARRLIPLLLVGDKTKTAARAAGFEGPALATQSAAALGPILPVLKQDGVALYLAGTDRKPDLESAARGAGLDLRIIETYQAAPVASLDQAAQRALAEGSIDAILHFSRRSAALFLGLMESAALQAAPLRHFCLSEDVAVPLREAGCADIQIAGAPSESALLTLVQA